jgi:pyruvate formate lyase activating enzyme
MHLPYTPIETLEKHYEVAKQEGMRYVYIGNVPGHPYENTYCPGCGKVVIKRYSYDILAWNLDDQNRCKFCGYKIPIVGKLSKNVTKMRFLPVFFS